MKFLLVFLWGIFFCLNVQAAPNRNISGFVLFDLPNINNLAPISKQYERREMPDLNLDNAGDLTIIIYSHGQKTSQGEEDCTKPWNQIPLSLRVLTKNNNTYFYYLCSKSTDDAVRGSYIYKKKKEFNKLLDQLISAGVKPKNLFLSGWSAGGWASLMMMDQVEKKFNSAIVFAPAFAGPRNFEFPVWRKVIRPRQVKEMTEANKIKALIFAYEDDAYNRPKELNFLKEIYPDTVELVGYKCGNGHDTIHDDCKLDETKKIIENYIQNSR